MRACCHGNGAAFMRHGLWPVTRMPFGCCAVGACPVHAAATNATHCSRPVPRPRPAAGYPLRRTFADFVDSFWQLMPSARGCDAAAARGAAEAIISAAGIEDYQIGKTKVTPPTGQCNLMLYGLECARIHHLTPCCGVTMALHLPLQRRAE